MRSTMLTAHLDRQTACWQVIKTSTSLSRLPAVRMHNAVHYADRPPRPPDRIPETARPYVGSPSRPGSSDLWAASQSCSSSSRKQTNGRLYNPSGSQPTGQQFSIPYLQGKAAGSIVWDRVTLGGYSIDNQALSAASNVEDKPLVPTFSSILDLPLSSPNSSPQAPPTPWTAPPGPRISSPSPPSPTPPARASSPSPSPGPAQTPPPLLGIGRHPALLVPDPGKID